MSKRHKERLDCTSAEGCGERSVTIDRRDIKLFLPPPGSNRMGSAIFAVFECPLCSSSSKLRIGEKLLNRVVGSGGVITELAQQGRPSNRTQIGHTEEKTYLESVRSLEEVPDPNTNLP